MYPTPRTPAVPRTYGVLASFFLLLALCTAIACCDATALTSSATLQPCVGPAADPQEPPGCRLKLVAELVYAPSPSSSDNGSELMSAATVLSSVVDLALVPNSSTPATATLGGGGLRVNVSAAALSVQYDLTYQRQYPFGQSASIVSISVGQCATGQCESYTQLDGTLVSDPDGVCCACSTCASGRCAPDSLLSLWCTNTVSKRVACLQSSPQTYDGYGVGSGRLHYPLRAVFSGLGLTSESGDAVLAFDVNATPTGTMTRAAASLGADGTMRVTTLEVVAAGPHDAVTVDAYVLFAPSGSPASSAAEWVLLPPALVSVDGKECDKVGVSAETYYRLAADHVCVESRTWCLRNQLVDFVSAAQGGLEMTGSYMAARMGAFAMSGARDVLVRTAQSGEGTVTLRWTSSADALAYTTDPSAGAIDAAVRVVDEASGNASLSVTVRNRGVRASWYGVRVASCSEGVRAGDAVPRLVLDAGASASVSLALVDGAADDATVVCVVVLTSSTGARVADASVSWRGRDPSTNDGPAPPTTSSTTTTTTSAPSSSMEAMCATCEFTDVWCAVKYVCVGRLYAWLGIVEGVLFVVWCIAYWHATLFPCWFDAPEDVRQRLFNELLEQYRPQIRAWYIEQAALRGLPKPVWPDEVTDTDTMSVASPSQHVFVSHYARSGDVSSETASLTP